jgi:hypothetical protein
MNQNKIIMSVICLIFATVFSTTTLASEEDDAIAQCLSVWVQNPFGTNPPYKTLSTSVKVFSMGSDETMDTDITTTPALVLVNPGVNVMGETKIELKNPNGWYCLRSNVNVMGSLKIKVNCKAHIASVTGGVAVAGTNSSKNGVTVMGNSKIELEGCD